VCMRKQQQLPPYQAGPSPSAWTQAEGAAQVTDRREYLQGGGTVRRTSRVQHSFVLLLDFNGALADPRQIPKATAARAMATCAPINPTRQIPTLQGLLGSSDSLCKSRIWLRVAVQQSQKELAAEAETGGLSNLQSCPALGPDLVPEWADNKQLAILPAIR
jgi:hypothetical protein